MADQDDLLLLHHLRAQAGDCCRQREASRVALADDPGRAAGRVLAWSIGRTVTQVQRFGRRSFEPGSSLTPNPTEARMLRIVRALSQGDREAAGREAEWLVGQGFVADLLDRMAPLTAFYGTQAAAPRRLAAQA
jgi:hypothetical protein